MSTITLSDGTTTLALDPDLYWEDEFSWASVEQSMSRSLTGKPIVQIGQRVAGRPITLRAFDESSAWVTRQDLDQIRTWADQPGRLLTLSMRGQTYQVMFRHQDGPHEAQPVVFYSDPGATDWMLATLRLMTVVAP